MLRILILILAGWAAQAAERPYVVLLSLDGFRWDYAEKYGAQNLLRMRQEGAWATGLIPAFPSQTFPNHLTLVTGRYPENHGLVANRFWDAQRGAEYDMGKTYADGSWFQSPPLWVLAERQGIRTAPYFWPASDAVIEGIKPSLGVHYDGAVTNEARIDTIVGYLRLPEAERPHFVTLYFSDTDDAGHHYGPDAEETRAAVGRVDGLVGELWRKLQATGLPVNLVIAADHGMQKVTEVVDLRKLVDLRSARLVTGNGFASIYTGAAAETERIYRDLKKQEHGFLVYRRSDVPARLHFSANPRNGDLVVIATGPVSISATANPGQHGYDPYRFETMHGILQAIGPQVKPGAWAGRVEAVHLMPWMAGILGVRMEGRIDGEAAVLSGWTR